MSKITRFFSGAVFATVLLFSISALSPQAAQAASLTSAQISAIIGLLQSFGADQATINNVQISLNGGTSTGGGTQAWCHTFNSDLTVGSTGADVSALNQALSSSGIDTTGNSSSFTENTAGDVVSFQAKYGIRQTGYVGPITRSKLNNLYRCSVTIDPLPPLPFCGQPPMPTCSADLACIQMMPQPKTYTNYTDFKNDRAQYLYDGYCKVSQSIQTISPNGGEQWQKGTTQTIKWSAPSSVSTVSVSLESWYECLHTPPYCALAIRPYVIAASTQNDGVFEWTVGKDAAGNDIPTGQYIVHIEATDGSVADSSDAPFTITQGTAIKAPAITGVRSTTYYDFPYGGNLDLQWGPSSLFRQDLANDIATMKQNGFDTVWFIIGLKDVINSDGTANTDNINNVKFVLNTLRQHNMKAILPLSYRFRQGCAVLTDAQKYKEYVSDNEVFLRQIESYGDMAYIVIFTESVWGCTDVGNSYPTPAGGEKLSQSIRSTLGRLPVDLPYDLRSKFTFGFHDSFVSEGWNQGTSAMYQGQNSYDFFSFPNYSNGDRSGDKIRADIDARINRIRSMHPSIPLFSGETGSSYCLPTNEAQQADALTTMASYLASKGIGFNVWQWKPIFFRDADSITRDCGFGGHAITNPDGSLKTSAQALRILLTSTGSIQSVTSTGLNVAFQPWAGWVRAPSLDSAFTIRLFDNNGKMWAENIPIILSADKSWMSFRLPANSPPSQCNIGKSCTITAQIVTPATSPVVYKSFIMDLLATN